MTNSQPGPAVYASLVGHNIRPQRRRPAFEPARKYARMILPRDVREGRPTVARVAWLAGGREG